MDIENILKKYDINKITQNEVNQYQETLLEDDRWYAILPAVEIMAIKGINAIHKFSFNKFMASNITGNVVLKNKQILISPLSFQSMDGTIDGLVIIDGNKESKLLISCEAKIKQVDIKKLFYQLALE